MKRIMFLMIAIFAVFCFTAPMATASMIPLGDPQIVGSWAQQFNESGVGNFDKMEFFMLSSGTPFEAPGVYGLASGWTGSLVNPNYALATGTDVTNMNFYVKFMPASSVPLNFDFLAWDGSTLKEAVHANWSGSGWGFQVFTGSYSYLDNYNRAVPEPSTMLLLGFGLVGLAGAGRKANKNNQKIMTA